MSKLRVPIKDVVFRASSIGIIVSSLIRNELTEVQKKRKIELELKLKTPLKLTDSQQKDFDKLDKLDKRSETQQKKYDVLKLKKETPEGLTTKQELELSELIRKDNAKPELSQGAKSHIKDIWLENEKEFVEDIQTKYTKKGTQGEEDGINLLSFVDGIMYIKNTERITKDHLTGECDINTYFEESNLRVIDDNKNSWSPKTFMNAKLSTIYEWQGRSYMYLYNADIFRLRYCLVDCPPDIYLDELKKFCWKNNIIDESLPQYQPLINQFEKNHFYDNSGNYNQEERVKTFTVVRDKKLEKLIPLAIELALDYYKSITLNMID